MSHGMHAASGDAFPCSVCGTLVWTGQLHTCAGTPIWQRSTTFPMQLTQPIQLYAIQCCPVCEGRGNVPPGFYGRMTVATDTAPEPCQTCDGKGILRVTMFGGVEKVS